MTSDTLKRARWTSSRAVYGLYACEKDGGALLATIVEVHTGFRWRLQNGIYGTEETKYAARVVRKALREAS